MTPTTPAPGALQGVRVVELGTLIAGPMAGRILADFGADVIKIENPSSADPMRTWGKARVDGRALWWAVHARNKRVIAADLRSEDGLRVVRELLAHSDVLIENFRPGTLERLGLGPEELWETNPGLVIARVSGYGQTGANAAKPGYASVAEAAGGLRHLNGYPDQAPPRAGISLGDSLASLYAVQGIMMALYHRDARGGKGQIVDVSLVESCFSLLESAVPDHHATGYVAQPSGSRLDGIAPSNIYRSADQQWVVIAANQDTVFARLAEALGQPELARDERFRDHVARGKNQDELDGIIAAWAAERSSEAIQATLDAHGVPTSGVNSIDDIFADPMFRERDMLVPLPDEHLGTIMHPGVIPKLTGTPGAIRSNGAWTVGEHTEDVLRDVLDMDPADIDRLREEGAIR